MGEPPAGITRQSLLLLGPDDPPAFKVINPSGASPFLLFGDHAGREIPRRLEGLGLPAEAMDLHIAWDIGIAGLGEILSARLDACFVRQTYSRLVIDCNRRPGDPSAIPTQSDGVTIPGNLGLDPAQAAVRRAEIHDPYQAAITGRIAARQARGQDTLLVSLHSFTPVFQGFERPWRFGVLHRGDSVFSRRVLTLLRAAEGDAAGDNQPYAMDGTDNTVPLHADAHGLDYLELEVRQDLLADAAGQARIADQIAPLFIHALRKA